jgi:uncharacterized membrane protein
MMYVDVNFVAVLVAAVLSFVIGFLWHGPVFGKQWLALMNISEAEQQKAQQENMLPRIVSAFIQQAVIAYVFALFAAIIHASTMMDALQLGFWSWVIVAAVLLNGVLWEKRSVPLYLFNIVYHFVIMVAMSLVIVLWM